MNAMPSKDTDAEANPDSAPPISVSRFLDISGLSSVTLWRWEKLGRLRVVRIAGRKYITAVALREFNRRLEAGEFAGNISNPSRHTKPKREI